jgi:N-acetylglucosamine malate deacetylase 1
MKRILVIAPHADDEVIGCGGTIIRASNDGAQVTLVVMGMGGIKHCHLSSAITIDERLAELQASCQKLGILQSKILFPGFDMRLEDVPMLELVKALDDILSTEEFDECYLPEPTHNLDHRRTYEAALSALRPCGRPLPDLIALYEGTVPAWQSPAGGGGSLFVDVADTLETKIAALHAHTSQLRVYPHPTSEESVRRLAAMRGLESGLQFAERFHLIRMVRR